MLLSEKTNQLALGLLERQYAAAQTAEARLGVVARLAISVDGLADIVATDSKIGWPLDVIRAYARCKGVA